ncbi:KilA-N domain-containing protein [Salmonella enterica subsp. enterica serovar Typhimurium str. DT104]|nr:KilA-N domain-containing protein [Salmonella enterica]CQL97398.1 KilA-N domain-containing protein [Salmonella enterica subsp. enterica serovar Typhimurium str. DT104]
MNNLMVIDGIEVRRDVHGRYCLNDLHRAAGGEQKYRPKYWLDNKQTRELIEQLFTEGGIPPSEQNQSVSFFQGGSDTQNLGIAPVNTVRGGAEQGTYVCKELVFAYVMWISPSFHLKVIRTFDRITSAPQTSSGMAADKMQAGVILLGFMRKELNLSNSSVLGACQKLQEAVGLPNLAPQYAIDAPAGALDGSSRPTLALSALLKQHGIRMTANQAYQQLAKLGVVEHRERYSRSAINGIKKFWSLTARKYQSAACVAIIEQLRRLPKPSTELAAVEIILYPPDKRIRDLDNYNKALFDALTHAGVWEDDSQVKRMLVEWGPVFPKGKVEITITKFETGAGAAA